MSKIQILETEMGDLVDVAKYKELEKERDHAVEALRAIANPIAAMQKAVPKGHLFSGAMAVQIAADPAYYQGIAQKALDKIERNKP